MAAIAKNIFIQNFWTPASTIWTNLKNDTLSSFTRNDITDHLWNSVICSAPLIAGGVTAHLINTFAHENLPKNLPVKRLFSVLCTAGSVIVGASVSFLVIRLLSANHGTLAPFTADKALKLETLHGVTVAIISPIAFYFSIPLWQFIPKFFGTAAIASYFGERSLYVIGSLSALHGAMNAAFIARPAPDNWA
jgi:hypothetical protein